MAFVLALAFAGDVAAQPRPVLSDQEILIQLERDWDAAFMRKDLTFIADVVADDAVFTYGDGSRGDKARELKLSAEDNQQVDSSVLDEFIVKVNRDTAVVMFRKTMTGPSQGKPLTVVLRYIDVFVQRDGQWKCIASQSVRVTAP